METPTEPTPAIELAILSGLSLGTGGNGRNVRENRVVTIDESGLVFHAAIQWPEYRNLLQSIAFLRNRYHLILADAVKEGRERFGEEKVAALLEEFEFNEVDVQKASVIGWMNRDCRHPFLTTEHYWVANRTPPGLTELEQYAWLKTAVDLKLAPIELQRSIQAGKVVRLDESQSRLGHNTGFATIETVVQMFQQWSRRSASSILTAEPDTRKRWLEEVAPIEETIRKVKESLA